MEPYFKQTHDALLAVSVDEQNMIHIRMAGNLTKDNLEMVLEWDKKVREAMRYVASRCPGRVLTLIDVSEADEADEKAIAVLEELMTYNEQFATRTGVWGANYFLRILVDLALKVAGRDNMHLFDTRDQALQWLREV